MSQLCCSTTLVPGDLLSKLEVIATAGFTGVDLSAADLREFTGTPEDIAQKAGDLGLRITCVHAAGGVEGIKGLARMTQALGAKTLVITSADLTEHCIQYLRNAAKNCRIALLALPWAAHIRTDRQAYELVQQTDHPNVGLALNSIFSLADGSQPARLRDIQGDRILHIQLADAPSLDFDPTRLKTQAGLLPGQGDLNLQSFVRIMARSGYKGPWSLGHISDADHPAQNTMARDGYRAMVSLLDEVAATEPTLPKPIPNLPERVQASGFEFIEFAADGPTGAELTKMLTAMCFRKERQHVSKSVELWRQGAVNIVVNTQKDGFAADAFASHGPSVCDMGLRVKDAAQTVARATTLGAPAFAQPVGAGELDIPAIKGVGGSVVHFIDEKSDLHRVWDIEFDPVPKTRATPPAGLRRIDHVAQTMRYEDMQSWLTYYTTTFDLDKAPIVNVTDPSGVVRSQALRSPEGEVRLNLNGASERQTFAGTFLADSFGAGVQHIAFLSDDIFETSDHLTDADFPRLPIPESYYKDLRTEFDLSAAFINALRRGHILYDRDGASEYFQIYGLPIFNGFFFEVVERRGGYQGYGARNAPIRLAAQRTYLQNRQAA